MQKEIHELAMLIPEMAAGEYTELVKDIADNGLIEPITLYEGKILDGRHRYRACMELGLRPDYEQLEGGDALQFVISKNLHRRHLDETQRGLIASRLANMTKTDAANKRWNATANLQLHKKFEVAEAAEMLNVSPRTVAIIKAVEREMPELIPQMEAGTLTAHAAYKAVKKKRREAIIEEQVKEIEMNLYQPPTGLYDVIAIDPPWPYGTKYDPDGRRAANPYPEMSLEEIGAIKLPSSDNCVLWLWTTHKFMKHSFELLERWGFRDVAIVTWVKSRMGLGSWLRSQSEFCIMAVKGSPLINLTNQTTVIYGDMREHSRKPDEFYEMVDGLCAGYKIDWFSREKRDGWAQFGNDMEKFT